MMNNAHLFFFCHFRIRSGMTAAVHTREGTKNYYSSSLVMFVVYKKLRCVIGVLCIRDTYFEEYRKQLRFEEVLPC